MPQQLDPDEFIKRYTVSEGENQALGKLPDPDEFVAKYAMPQNRPASSSSGIGSGYTANDKPPVMKPPVPSGLQGKPTPPTPSGRINTTLNAIGDYGAGARQDIQSGYAGMSDPNPERKAHAVHQMATGVGKLALPLAAPALAAAPGATLLGAAGAYAGNKTFDKAAELLKLKPGYREVAGDVGAVAGGSIGGVLPSIGRGFQRAYQKFDPRALAQGVGGSRAAGWYDFFNPKTPPPPPAAKVATPKPPPAAPTPKPLSPKDAAAQALADSQAKITSGTSTTGQGTSLPSPAPRSVPRGRSIPGSQQPVEGTPYQRPINIQPAPAPPARTLPTAAQQFPNTSPAPVTGPPASGTIPSPPPAPAPPGRVLPTAAQQFPNTPPVRPTGPPAAGTVQPPPPAPVPPGRTLPTAAQQFPNQPPDLPPAGPTPQATPVAPPFGMQGLPEPPAPAPARSLPTAAQQFTGGPPPVPPAGPVPGSTPVSQPLGMQVPDVPAAPAGPTAGTSGYGGQPLPGTELPGHTFKSPRASTATAPEAKPAPVAATESKPGPGTGAAKAKPEVAKAADALAEELVPGGKPGEVRTIPAAEPKFSKEQITQFNSLLKKLKGNGVTPESYQSASPAEKAGIEKIVNEGTSRHGDEMVNAILNKLKGMAKGGMVVSDMVVPDEPVHFKMGGMVVPEEPQDWSKFKFNRIFSADTTSHYARKIADMTGTKVAKRTRQLSADNRTFLNFVKTELDTHDANESVAWVLPESNATVLAKWVAGGARNNLDLGSKSAHTSAVQRLRKVGGRVTLDQGTGPGIFVIKEST